MLTEAYMMMMLGAVVVTILIVPTVLYVSSLEVE